MSPYDLIKLLLAITGGIGMIFLMLALARAAVRSGYLRSRRSVLLIYILAGVILGGASVSGALGWFALAIVLWMFASFLGLFAVFARAELTQQRQVQEERPAK